MSKPIITRLFVGGFIAAIAGIVLATVAFVAAWAGGVFQISGSDVIGINMSGYAGTMFALMTLGGVAIAGGALSGLVAWIGALINTAQLEDKMWFVLLLVLGVFSFGWVAMIAYVIAGPDSTQKPYSPHVGAAA